MHFRTVIPEVRQLTGLTNVQKLCMMVALTPQGGSDKLVSVDEFLHVTHVGTSICPGEFSRYDLVRELRFV